MPERPGCLLERRVGRMVGRQLRETAEKEIQFVRQQQEIM